MSLRLIALAGFVALATPAIAADSASHAAIAVPAGKIAGQMHRPLKRTTAEARAACDPRATHQSLSGRPGGPSHVVKAERCRVMEASRGEQPAG